MNGTVSAECHQFPFRSKMHDVVGGDTCPRTSPGTLQGADLQSGGGGEGGGGVRWGWGWEWGWGWGWGWGLGGGRWLGASRLESQPRLDAYLSTDHFGSCVLCAILTIGFGTLYHVDQIQ